MSEINFGPTEERTIIALAFEIPEFFSSVCQHIEPDFFKLPEAKLVYRIINESYDSKGIIPTRQLTKDICLRHLTADDNYEDVLSLVDHPLDPREAPIVKDTLIDWARNRAYGQLYSEEAFEAWESANYDRLEEIIHNANKIQDVSASGLWFFDDIDALFSEERMERLTCGFPNLDVYINNGGPCRGEVFVWMAPTGVGKSITLVNNGVALVRAGYNVLHVTLELSKEKTRDRYMGAFTEESIKEKQKLRGRFTDKLRKQKMSYDGRLAIYEFPPDHINVDTIRQLCEYLRRHKNWKADVIIIDYMELMLSRHSYNNKEEYLKQKRVATEVRGLASTEHALIFTATQTNRAGNQRGEDAEATIGINKIAESYGKAMPIDYLVSINQSEDEYRAPIPKVRFFIVKNRNGQREITVRASINYNTMVVKEDAI